MLLLLKSAPINELFQEKGAWSWSLHPGLATEGEDRAPVFLKWIHVASMTLLHKGQKLFFPFPDVRRVFPGPKKKILFLFLGLLCV